MAKDEKEEFDDQDQTEESDQEEAVEDETVEENESATEDEDSAEVEHVDNSGDLMQKLEDLSVSKILLIGALFGLLAGLIGGYALSPSNAAAGDSEQATQALTQLVDSSQFNGTVDVGEPVNQHGMYYYNVTMNMETQNGTQTSYRQFYMTKDAELMFPVIQGNPFAPSMPINVQEYLAQQRAQQEETENEAAP